MNLNATFQKKPPLREVSLLFRFMSTLLQAGLPLTRAIDFSRIQAKTPILKEAFGTILSDIHSGHHLSESFAKFPNLFSELMIQMIVVGENSGTLPDMLFKINRFLEKRLQTRSSIKSALAYPMILLFVCISVVVFMLVSAVPKLSEIFENIGAELPPITRFFVSFSDFLMSYGLPLAVLLIAAGVGIRVWMATKAGSLIWDRLKLHIFFFGPLMEKSAASLFASTFSILLTGGVSMLKSLEITASAAENTYIRQNLLQVKNAVENGDTLHEAIGKAGLFNETVRAMVAVGEESGGLDRMLLHVQDIYDQEVEVTIQTFTKLIEPIMILSMTVIVGFIAAAILIPIADLSTAVG